MKADGESVTVTVPALQKGYLMYKLAFIHYKQPFC